MHHLPFLVNQLLWTLTAQTVHQFCVVAHIATNQLS